VLVLCTQSGEYDDTDDDTSYSPEHTTPAENFNICQNLIKKRLGGLKNSFKIM
jgi:hypothetical protein